MSILSSKQPTGHKTRYLKRVHVNEISEFGTITMKMISSARNNGRTNEDWFHKYSCHSSRASEICQRPSIVTLVTHIRSNLYMKRWTRLVINAPRASSTGLAMWPSQNFSFSSSCWTCLENLHQVFLSSSCWDL